MTANDDDNSNRYQKERSMPICAWQLEKAWQISLQIIGETNLAMRVVLAKYAKAASAFVFDRMLNPGQKPSWIGDRIELKILLGPMGSSFSIVDWSFVSQTLSYVFHSLNFGNRAYPVVIELVAAKSPPSLAADNTSIATNVSKVPSEALEIPVADPPPPLPINKKQPNEVLQELTVLSQDFSSKELYKIWELRRRYEAGRGKE